MVDKICSILDGHQGYCLLPYEMQIYGYAIRLQNDSSRLATIIDNLLRTCYTLANQKQQISRLEYNRSCRLKTRRSGHMDWSTDVQYQNDTVVTTSLTVSVRTRHHRAVVSPTDLRSMHHSRISRQRKFENRRQFDSLLPSAMHA